ncbi:MAG: hypothetical protein EOO73_20395 [Myxococcales bacterium]|nr:MAG: hypothetical protein EOO73_20395 [Myxococcales bacterium]
MPDVATATMADCATLEGKLVTRYDFEGTGTTVTDRIGVRHGVVRSAQLSKIDGKGVVLLGGGTNGGYVDLPNDLLGGLKNATFEAWLSWGAGEAQQRIFDFGDTTNNVEGSPGTGRSYFFASPQASSARTQVGFSLDGVSGEEHWEAAGALPTSLSQVVVVADDDEDRVVLYVNGKKASEGEWLGALSALHVVNAWLGRSQWDRDPELSGVFHEFRVYGAALSAAEVTSTYAGGPDPVYLAY